MRKGGQLGGVSSLGVFGIANAQKSVPVARLEPPKFTRNTRKVSNLSQRKRGRRQEAERTKNAKRTVV